MVTEAMRTRLVTLIPAAGEEESMGQRCGDRKVSEDKEAKLRNRLTVWQLS